MIDKALHIPVLLEEAIVGLEIKPSQWYIDATFGRGGHTTEILNSGGKVIAFDFDQKAINYGKEKFASAVEKKDLILVRENFSKIEEVLEKFKIEKISGILFDFGTSVDQLTNDNRGFSFGITEAPLDMRMDCRLGVTASDLLKVLSEKQLSQIFCEYGGEEQGKRIAKEVVRIRRKYPQNLETVGSFVDLILKAKTGKRGRIHQATKTFQGLRIAVNDELTNIQESLPQALKVLKSEGKLITIAFHEGEDRIVKELFKQWENQNLGKQTQKKTIQATQEEIEKNPKSRSARMRIFKKI